MFVGFRCGGKDGESNLVLRCSTNHVEILSLIGAEYELYLKL